MDEARIFFAVATYLPVAYKTVLCIWKGYIRLRGDPACGGFAPNGYAFSSPQNFDSDARALLFFYSYPILRVFAQDDVTRRGWAYALQSYA